MATKTSAPKVTQWIATCNIGREKSAGFRADVIGRLHDGFPKDPVIVGWQEIDEADKGNEHAAVAKAFTGYSSAGWDQHEPISVPPDWQVVDTSELEGHPGIAGISPNRKIILATLRHTRTGIEYVHVNSHPVAGAFTNPGQAKEGLRLQYWQQWFGILQQTIADTVAEGRTVVFTADTNRPKLPKIHPDEHRFIEAGIDYVIAVEPKDPMVSVRKVNTRRIPLRIDGHSGHAANIEFTTKG